MRAREEKLKKYCGSTKIKEIKLFIRDRIKKKRKKHLMPLSLYLVDQKPGGGEGDGQVDGH
jgi:hypothetical protein